MKYKIGIFGSAQNNDKGVIKKAKELGLELSKYRDKIILITGATTGLTNDVAYTASKNGVEIWGFPPTKDMKSLKQLTPELDFSIYNKLTFIPENFSFTHNVEVCRKYRNVTSTATCNAGITISGKWGTMNEFTNLYDMGKVIGVLTGTGGISDELNILNKKLRKKSKAVMIFGNNPKKLIAQLIKRLKNHDK
ncbi:hypothetical protein HY041_00610 [Candidatus Roizmanbacteria bacterium]|nr:hypothetical protein [Candidatus Roizmanbacteria bacterium]